MSDFESSVAVFCTADDGYIVPALIALESVRRFHPDCGYFVIGNANGISLQSIELLRHHGIGFIHCDRNEAFQNDVWPNTAYLSLFGPELFAERGYRYSLGLDADVLCVLPLELEQVCAVTHGFAGIANQDPRSSNFSDPGRVRELYGLADEVMRGTNTNTGVVFWNNQAAASFRLGERSGDCYRELAENGVPVVGDQALFALVSVLGEGLPFQLLDYRYNYRLGNEKDLKRSTCGVRIFHYTGTKPWHPWSPGSCWQRLFPPKWSRYRKLWLDFVRKRQLPFPGRTGGHR